MARRRCPGGLDQEIPNFGATPVPGCALTMHIGVGFADVALLQATGQGLYQVTGFGIAAVVANLVGGQVYASLGASALFGGAAVLGVAAAILAVLVFPRAGEPQVAVDDLAASLPFAAPTLG